MYLSVDYYFLNFKLQAFLKCETNKLHQEMSTNTHFKFPITGSEGLDKSSLRQRSGNSEHEFYTEVSSTNRNKRLDLQAQKEKYSAVEYLATREKKPSKLSSLLEHAKDIGPSSKVIRFSTGADPSRGSKVSLRSQAMDIEPSQIQSAQFQSKKNSGTRFYKTPANFETESQQRIQPVYDQRQSMEEAQGYPMIKNQHDIHLLQSKGLINSFGVQNQNYPLNTRANDASSQMAGSQHSLSRSSSTNQMQELNMSAFPKHGRRHTLYKYLNQYFDEGAKTDQIAQKPGIKQVSSQENLLQTAERSNGTATTCDTYYQPQQTSKESPIKLALSNKISEVVKMPPNTERKTKKGGHQVWASGKEHLLELFNRNKKLAEQKNAQKLASRKVTFSLQEDEKIIKYHKVYGPDWKSIAKHLPGRTESMIRNRFFTLAEKYPNIENEQESSQQICVKPEEPLTNKDLSNELKGESFNLFGGFNAESNQNFSNLLFDDRLNFEKNDQGFNNELLFPEEDFLNGGTLSGAVEQRNNDMELIGFTPQLEPVDNMSLFDLKLDEKDVKFNNDQDCWNDLLDFNQEIKTHHNLTPVFTAVNSNQSQIVEKKHSETIAQDTNVKNQDLLAEAASVNRIQELLKQINSIEQMFKATRQEILKLQGKLGDK